MCCSTALGAAALQPCPAAQDRYAAHLELSTLPAALLLMLMMGCQVSEAASLVAVRHCLWWQREALALLQAGLC